MVERLAEKIDNLKERRPTTSDYDEEDNSLPPRNGEREDITIGDNNENDEEGAASEDEEVGEQRFNNSPITGT